MTKFSRRDFLGYLAAVPVLGPLLAARKPAEPVTRNCPVNYSPDGSEDHAIVWLGAPDTAYRIGFLAKGVEVDVITGGEFFGNDGMTYRNRMSFRALPSGLEIFTHHTSWDPDMPARAAGPGHYVAGRTEVRGKFGQLLGPRALVIPFLDRYGNVCNAATNNLVVETEGKAFMIENVVITSVGLSRADLTYRGSHVLADVQFMACGCKALPAPVVG